MCPFGAICARFSMSAVSKLLTPHAPIEQGRIMKNRDLLDIAGKLNVAPSVLALAWVIRNPLMIAIPKTSSVKHLRENAKALAITLDHEVLQALDEIFLPPTRKQPLEVI